jgi:translation initiation factor IF-2
MRARGAQITDVVVLVVAADDGVMPQTIEAIDHAQAAEVPIVVAINKIDKPNAQPERIRQELTRFNLTDEQWGGKTIMRGISALTGEGVKELMELLSLETELLELKANPKKRPRGTVIEAEISRGLGPVAWVLVQSGTLRVGDAFLAGETYGRVRSMQDSRGNNVDEAGPSTPVVVTGFSSAAHAGDSFVGVEEERIARAIAEKRVERTKMRSGPAARRQTLEEFHEQMLAGEKHELNILIKADVQGSVDVLQSSMSKLGNEEVKVRIIHSGVGGINESDVMLASASDAVILGFHIDGAAKVQKLAENEGVTIRTYKVIYEAIQDVHKALEGLLTPEESELVTGHAEVRATFKSSALGVIAGCYVRDGEIRRDAMVRVLRDGKPVFQGKIGSLRREKDDVTSAQTGYECGIKVAGFDSIAEGDIVEAYKMQSVAKTLA